MMQLLLSIIIFAAFATAGYLFWRRYKQRKVFFDNLLSFCNHLLVEISFSKNTVLSIIENYARGYNPAFQNVLHGYRAILENKQDVTRERLDTIMWKHLKPAERAAVTDFFYELGRHGSTQEREKIENKKLVFDTFHQTAAAALKKDANIYLKLFILLGVGVVIILI